MAYEYLDQLISDCKKAKNIRPLNTLIIQHGERIPDCLDKKTGIYVITEVGGDPEKTLEDMQAAKWPNGDKKAKTYMPRVNESSQTIYVGSSENLKRRLEEHIGEPASTTYALRMGNGWFKGKWRIEIEVYDLKKVKKALILLAEDNRAFELKPAFGKPGPNGK